MEFVRSVQLGFQLEVKILSHVQQLEIKSGNGHSLL